MIVGMFAMWLMLLLLAAITGIVFLCLYAKHLKPYKAPDEAPAGQIIRSLVRSPLFWSFTILCLSEFAQYYLPDIVSYFNFL